MLVYVVTNSHVNCYSFGSKGKGYACEPASTQISRFHQRFQDFTKISRFHEDFKISKKISRFQLRFQL